MAALYAARGQLKGSRTAFPGCPDRLESLSYCPDRLESLSYCPDRLESLSYGPGKLESLPYNRGQYRMPAAMRRPWFFFLLAVLGFMLDLSSKWLVFASLGRRGRHVLIPGVLALATQENQGVAFSLLRDRPALIFCLTTAALVFILWLYAKHWRTAPAVSLVALGLLLVGAAGNLADRVYFGHVRDFIDFIPRLPLVGHWPVFNLADMCITTGVLLYLLGEFLGKQTTSHHRDTETQRDGERQGQGG
ncbi:MAG: signal peptidase II [Planctomycetota bacterium]